MSDERTWFLVSCVSQKRSHPMPAKDLYCSDWFTKARAYVEAQKGRRLVLSAKHGMVEPDQVIAPYEETLYDKTAEERRNWATSVADEVSRRMRRGDRVVILAGSLYREHLVPLLKEHGCEVEVPMRGLGIGQQKAWLKRRVPKD
jgi:hypothetical protein